MTFNRLEGQNDVGLYVNFIRAFSVKCRLLGERTENVAKH